MNILVTGATGFLGRNLYKDLIKRKFLVRIAVRSKRSVNSGHDEIAPNKVFYIGEIDRKTDWSSTLLNLDVVIHTAAKNQIANNEHVDSLSQYRETNVAGTLNLAKQAAEAGVKRFIFVSSIKVHGESTFNGEAFKLGDKASPESPYAVSKWEAEQGLMQLAKQTDMQIVIIRPPLVYGPGATGNFSKLVKLAKSGIPLPFGSLKNKRSLISVHNLIDLIVKCIDHPNAPNQVILASDGEDISTGDLLIKLGDALNQRIWLIPIPESALTTLATFLRRPAVASRLLGSLQVDITRTQAALEWTPPFSIEQGLRMSIPSQQV